MTSPTSAPARLTHADGSPVRALVVDDEVSLGDLLQMALRYEGWEVKTAVDGQSALTSARQFKPDVIVLDVMLPDLNGVRVVSALRASGDQTPVLFLTALDSTADRVDAYMAGGDDYMTKPFSLEEVAARLSALVQGIEYAGSAPR